MADTSSPVDLLTTKMAAIALQLTPEQIYTEARAAYINSKADPTEAKEKAHLEQRLALTFSEKKLNESYTEFEKITSESKLGAYKHELSNEFDELSGIKEEETKIIEQYIQDDFKPGMFSRNYFESDDLYEKRVRVEREKCQKNFIQDNRERILLDVLRAKIRNNPEAVPEGKETLDKEEKAQVILTPLYNRRIVERKQELNDVQIARAFARYYAKPPVVPEKNITNDAPKLPAEIGTHYRIQLLQKELSKQHQEPPLPLPNRQKRSALIKTNEERSRLASEANKIVTDARVFDGCAVRFRPIV